MSTKLCSIPDCEREHASRGWCSAHYRKWMRWGDPLAKRPRNSTYVHGHAAHPQSATYIAWCAMHQRCRQTDGSTFRNYAARGIKVCERWSVFPNFLADMGEKPDPQMTLERIDNDNGYSPDNCKWATRQEQVENQRSNHMITYQGRDYTLTNLAKLIGMERRTFGNRIMRYGWSLERAINEPVHHGVKEVQHANS